MDIGLHLTTAGPVEQMLCPGVRCSQVRMERTTVDVQRRIYQAAHWATRLELGLFESRPVQRSTW